MTKRLPSPEFASRLAKACLATLYTAIALLGSGGLHAIAPGCNSACCVAKPGSEHPHHGCSHHHHHSHGPATDSKSQEPENGPARCPQGCLICEFAATPAVTVAVVQPLPLAEALCEVTPPADRHVTADAPRLFSIRGPPALG